MKKILFLIVVCAVLLLANTSYGLAAAPAPGAAGTLSENILKELNTTGTQAGFAVRGADQSLPFQIGILIRGVMGLLGVIFLILVVYAGYKWMLAHGEPGEVKEAQKLLLHSLIGLVITSAAYALTNFVINAVSSAVFTR